MESTTSIVSRVMKTTILSVCFSLFAASSYSQFYYNDILVTGENMKKRAVYQQQGVKSVRFNSFDNKEQPIEGFKCEQIVKNNFTVLVTTTNTSLAGTSWNTSTFNAAGQLMKIVDTTDGSSTTTTYSWDASNRLSHLTSISLSPGNYITREEHVWLYDATGKPQRMLKIKNNSDTTFITFVADDRGNVGEEKSLHRGEPNATVYYYYDDNNRLTDIVRYNARAKRLLPDYIFEYDAQGRTTSMLATTEGNVDYQKWIYSYNEKGLKGKDLCFSKTKVLIGKIEYSYQF